MPWMSINKWKRLNLVKAKTSKRESKTAVFKLLGYDVYSHEWYYLDEFPTEKEAKEAGIKHFEKLEVEQPTSTSGGQDGIQDRVYIERPNGSKYRIFPSV